MNYAEIKKTDIANGEGVRVSLFVSGCTHRCKNCFNAVAWDFHYGKPFTKQTEDELIAALANPKTNARCFRLSNESNASCPIKISGAIPVIRSLAGNLRKKKKTAKRRRNCCLISTCSSTDYSWKKKKTSV